MPKAYKSKYGREYNLNLVSANSTSQIERLQKEYLQIAIDNIHSQKKSIFYFLRNENVAYFFTIPVDADEIADLGDIYGEEYYIGVAYRDNYGEENREEDNKNLYERNLRLLHERCSEEMSGKEFEKECVEILNYCGYSNVKRTPASGDHGVDIVAYKDGKRYAVQCKRYQGNIGFKAVQEIFTGKALFHADYGIIMTNSHFAKQAKEDAKRLNIDLWDGDKISAMIEEIGQ